MISLSLMMADLAKYLRFGDLAEDVARVMSRMDCRGVRDIMANDPGIRKASIKEDA